MEGKDEWDNSQKNVCRNSGIEDNKGDTVGFEAYGGCAVSHRTSQQNDPPVNSKDIDSKKAKIAHKGEPIGSK